MPDNNPSGLIGWPDDARLYVLERAREAVSATQIAREVGQKFGIKKTRNAVIGIVHRSGRRLRGIPMSGKGAKAVRVPRRLVHPRPQPPSWRAMPLPSPMPADIARVSTDDLAPHHCRWPCGDPKDVVGETIFYCGLTKVPGLPYCHHHALRAYEPPKPGRPLPRFRGASGAFDKTKGLNEFESA